MPTESHGFEPGKSPPEEEGGLFPSNPIWDRSRKRRGFGGRKAAARAAEPRSFAPEEPYRGDPYPEETFDEPMPLDRPVGATPTYAEEPEPLVAPIGRADREPESRGTGAAAAVIGGILAIALIAAGGWYFMRDRAGVPELAPGTPVTSEVATAPLAPAPVPAPGPLEPAASAAAPPPSATARAEPPPAPARTERRVASTARARPAAPAAAETSSVDASATLPDGPQPYSALNPNAAPAPVNPSPSTEAAPPAAEPIPSTPPTAPETAPTQTPDQTPPAATPPQS